MLYLGAITKVTPTKSPLNMSTPNRDIGSIQNQLLEIRKNIQKIEKDNIQHIEDYLSMECHIFNLELEKEIRPSIGKQDNLEQWIGSIKAKFKKDYIEVLDLVEKLKKKLQSFKAREKSITNSLSVTSSSFLKGRQHKCVS